MTVVLERSEPGPPGGHLPLPSLLAIARHGMPRLLEATLVPSGLFYLGWWVAGSWLGFTLALLWSYGLLAHRLGRRRPVPGLLMLAVVGLTGRTTAALATGSTFIYFVIPVGTTAVVGAAFLLSTLTRRPFVARLAGDFCPLTDDITERPGICKLFRRLTALWAAINLLNAGVTYWLLSELSVGTFVGVKTATAATLTWGGVAVTVVWSLRVARAEGLSPGKHQRRVLRTPVGQTGAA